MARIDTPALPTDAVREALANAFIHRDYASAAGSVAVALYDDRLEIISAGELHFGLTPEALFRPHESKPWNPWIAGVFYRRGLIETWGRGTLKIAGLMHDAGLPPPTVATSGGVVTLTFILGDVAAEKSSEKILILLQANPMLSAKALADQLGISSRAVEKQIDLLKNTGKLQRIGAAKGGHWQVLD